MGSASQNLQYFGRALQVSVTPQGGGAGVAITNVPATPALRVTFEVKTYMLMAVWEAVVTIYNLSSSTASAISSGSAQNAMAQSLAAGNSLAFTQTVNMGDTVKISAGYQFSSSSGFNPASSLIYTGNLLQSIGTRQDVTDTKLVLRCVTNLAVASFGFLNFPRAKGATDYDVLKQILTNVQLSIDQIDQASQTALQSQTYPRGQGLFDRPFRAIDTICKQHNIFPWVGPNGLNIRSYGAAPSGGLTPKYVYAPANLSSSPAQSTASSTAKPTIIGTPEQTQDGIRLRVLMDSQVQIGDIIQLDSSTSINGYQFSYGTLPALPNAAGVYIVAGIRHLGDTRGRGEDWFTEITGLTPQWFSAFVAARTAS